MFFFLILNITTHRPLIRNGWIRYSFNQQTVESHKRIVFNRICKYIRTGCSTGVFSNTTRSRSVRTPINTRSIQGPRDLNRSEIAVFDKTYPVDPACRLCGAWQKTKILLLHAPINRSYYISGALLKRYGCTRYTISRPAFCFHFKTRLLGRNNI